MIQSETVRKDNNLIIRNITKLEKGMRMDFDFKREITGELSVQCSSGHEVIGHWITDEIGSDSNKIHEIDQIIHHLLSERRTEVRWNDRLYSAYFTREALQVTSNSLSSDNGENSSEEDYYMEDNMALYREEQEASCGLEDFIALFDSWREFIDSI